MMANSSNFIEPAFFSNAVFYFYKKNIDSIIIKPAEQQGKIRPYGSRLFLFRNEISENLELRRIK